MARIDGTKKNDTIDLFKSDPASAAEQNIVFADSGNDFVTGGRGSNEVHGGNGDDNIWGCRILYSNTGPDLLYGENGNDTIQAAVSLSGPNQLYGGNGDDVLRGASDFPTVDILDGGRDNDIVDGGRGADILTGGPGKDVFLFSMGYTGPVYATASAVGNPDLITDLKQGEDVIDLSQYQTAYWTATDGPQFLGTNPFTDGDGLQVRYDIVDGHTIVQFQSAENAVGSVQFFPSWYPQVSSEIDLVGVYNLTAADFDLI